MNREDRILVARETIEISQSGVYFLNGEPIEISTNRDTKYYSSEYLKNMQSIFTDVFRNIKNDKVGSVSVKNESTVKTIFDIGDNDKKIGVLNFASAYNIGGGFESGAMAQEEALAYCSNLAYIQSEEKEGLQYYKENKKLNYPIYTDGMLTGTVTFFRDENFNFVKRPIKSLVITAPAVNVSALRNKGDLNVSVPDIMYNRMKYILELFVLNKCTDIILGAFGCGVFGNNPYDIAEIWKKLLYRDGFIKCFNSVIFSVLDNSKEKVNINSFKEKFERGI